MRVGMYQEDIMLSETIQVPLSCPRCYRGLVAVKYAVSSRILKERCWHVCKSCGFSRDVEDFKQGLFSV